MPKLLQFTIGNYRSFNDERTFTFVPTSIQDEPKESVGSTWKYRFSTVSAVYGANSSGKSNLVRAISTMSYIVNHSVKLNDNEVLTYDPFLLSSSNADDKPMHFEIVYLNDSGQRIRYGFENNSVQIVREWLFVTSKTEEEILFVRDEEGIAVNDELFPEGVDREEMTNDNRLFLSLVAQLGGPVSKGVMGFFQKDCNVLSGLHTFGFRNYTKHKFKQQDHVADEAMTFFRHLKLGFSDIDVEEQKVDLSEVPDDIRPRFSSTRLETFSSHNVYDAGGKVTGKRKLSFDNVESDGTQKIFELAAPIFDTLNRGSILVIDELDAKMHPLISQQLVRLFTSEETNPNHAQLLFTTHDTNLLSAKLMRRDQIWFTEKDSTEATDLYRLTDIVFADGTKPRGDGNLEKNYIKGRYGAIPFITY